MAKTTQIQIRCDEFQKQQLREMADREGTTISQLLLERVLGASGRPLLEKHKKTLEQRGQAAKDYESLPVVDLPPELPEEFKAGLSEDDWISRRALQLKARMSSRAARRQAEIEWEEMG